jgi:predicted nucleic acid-binding protein
MAANRSRTIKRHDDWVTSLKLHFVPVDYIAAQRELRLLVNQGAASYDAIYIYLARELGHPLWTCDTGILALPHRRMGFSVVDLHNSKVSP